MVTTNMGGAPELVDDSCGRLVPPHDLAALVNALDYALYSPNRALRDSLGAAGRGRADDLRSITRAGTTGRCHVVDRSADGCMTIAPISRSRPGLSKIYEAERQRDLCGCGRRTPPSRRSRAVVDVGCGAGRLRTFLGDIMVVPGVDAIRYEGLPHQTLAQCGRI